VNEIMNRCVPSWRCSAPSACRVVPIRGLDLVGTPCPHVTLGHNVFFTEKEETVVISEMKEQYRNVYENKGPIFSGQGRSGDVAENKGSYSLKAGILLKRIEVRC